MKRMLLTLLAVVALAATVQARMSGSQVRKESRFLTDKMAYELNLSTLQYSDVYEINYDFINGIRYLMDDVLRGDPRATDRYYELLDIRNDDLRWVLDSRQYTRFMAATYFFRPVYVSGGGWHFRIYLTYSNRNRFYFPLPRPCLSYRGGHARPAFGRPSHYRGRYNHPHYKDSPRLYGPKPSRTVRRSDFGPALQPRRDAPRRPAERKREDVRNRRRDTPAIPPARRPEAKDTPRGTAAPAARRSDGKKVKQENKNARRSEVTGKRSVKRKD